MSLLDLTPKFHTQTFYIYGAASEMAGVSSLKVFLVKRRNINRPRLHGLKRLAHPREVIGGAKDDEIRIAAEFRGAVNDAGLPAYQKILNLIFI